MLSAAFWKIDPSDRAVSARQQLGKGKATPENRVLVRFHTGSVDKGLRQDFLFVSLERWDVLDALAPADHDLRHCRLLGFEAGRPRCWLYRIGDGRFVARWETARPLVVGTTPAAALAGLRRCATTYQHICGVELPFPASAPISRPKPLAAECELFVDCVKARDGFWREAKALSETACWYRGGFWCK